MDLKQLSGISKFFGIQFQLSENALVWFQPCSSDNNLPRHVMLHDVAKANEMGDRTMLA